MTSVRPRADRAAPRPQAQRRRAHDRLRAARGRGPQARRPAGRGPAADPVPRPARPTRRARRCCRARCSPAPARTTAPGSPPRSRRLGARPERSASTPTGLLISGNVLATGLRGLLDLLAVVLTEPTYAPRRGRDRARPRDRAADHRAVARRARSPPRRSPGGCGASTRTRSTCRRPTRSRRRRRAQVRALHRDRVRPDGAVLVVVGDVSPARVLDQVETALGGLDGRCAEAAHRRSCPTRAAARCSSSTGRARCSRRCAWARRR